MSRREHYCFSDGSEKGAFIDVGLKFTKRNYHELYESSSFCINSGLTHVIVISRSFLLSREFCEGGFHRVESPESRRASIRNLPPLYESALHSRRRHMFALTFLSLLPHCCKARNTMKRRLVSLIYCVLVFPLCLLSGGWQRPNDRAFLILGSATIGALLCHVVSRPPRRLNKMPTDFEKLSVLPQPWPYSENHKYLNILPPADDRFIGMLRISDRCESRDVLVKLRSAEGYATVAVLVNQDDPKAGWNRIPSQRDYEAVALAATQVAACYLRLGILPSIELLGNNSHGIDRETEGLVLGTEETPFSLHMHIIGRGDPKHSYIGEVPLRGLPPGQVMVPRIRREEFANQDEIRTVAEALATSLEEVELHPQVKLIQQRVSSQ